MHPTSRSKVAFGVGAILIAAAANAVTMDELQDRLISVKSEAEAIQQVADNENRQITAEEEKTISGLYASFEQTEAEIARRQKLAAMDERLKVPVRKTAPVDPAPQASTPAPRITGGESVAAKSGTGGFRNFGEFAKLVHGASVTGRSDPRLQVLNAATSNGSEGVGADGGYLVPPDFRTSILAKVMGEDSLLSRCDQNVTSSNSITVPTDESTPWQTSGGILANWEGEAVAIPQSKPGLQSFTVRANKLAALVPVTDELLEDAPSLEAYLRRKAPDKLNYKVNDAILNGDGVGKPTGLIAAACTVSQAAEGGQTAGTINYANVTKMWSRMYAPSRSKSVWIINQDVEPQLFAMTVTGGSPALPAYLPPGGLADKPYGMLLGRPVVYSEASAAVGTPGDIVLADLSQYLAVVKAGGVRTDVSMHLFFDQGLTAFRFVMRVGGAPWWASSITRAKSSLPLSCFVKLAAR